MHTFRIQRLIVSDTKTAAHAVSEAALGEEGYSCGFPACTWLHASARAGLLPRPFPGKLTDKILIKGVALQNGSIQREPVFFFISSKLTFTFLCLKY